MEPAYGSVGRCLLLHVEMFTSCIKIIHIIYTYAYPASGSSVHCELIIETHSMGPFAINLQCHLDQCDSTFNLPIEGCVQVCAYTVDVV